MRSSRLVPVLIATVAGILVLGIAHHSADRVALEWHLGILLAHLFGQPETYSFRALFLPGLLVFPFVSIPASLITILLYSRLLRGAWTFPLSSIMVTVAVCALLVYCITFGIVEASTTPGIAILFSLTLIAVTAMVSVLIVREPPT